MTLLPNIEVVEREESRDSAGNLEAYDYTINVKAVHKEVAERKVKNFLRAKHPADALRVDIGRTSKVSNDGIFSSTGPQMKFQIQAAVYK